MSNLPIPVSYNDLPSTRDARLPAVYEAAKEAIAQCYAIDECKEWADRMEALASYGRQAEDDTLLNHAKRIKGRAVRRCGQLLREIRPAKGKRTDLEPKGGASPKLSRKEAARSAGLSDDQQKAAIRVANVPEELFEGLVESEEPPTIEALADIGKQTRGGPPIHDYLRGRDPEDFHQGNRLIGAFWRIKDRASELDLAAASRGLDDEDRAKVRNGIAETRAWLVEVENVL